MKWIDIQVIGAPAIERCTFVLRFAHASRSTIFMENQVSQINETNGQLPTAKVNSGESLTDQTECLSSSFTLMWRIFVPIFGTVFLGGLLLTFLLIPEEDLYLSFPLLWAQGFTLILWLGWLFLMSRTLWRLKRVDANATHFFVTNYWTTVRYPWTDLEKMEEKTRLGRRIINLHLKAPGRFGQIISFLPSGRLVEWRKEHAGSF